MRYQIKMNTLLFFWQNRYWLNLRSDSFQKLWILPQLSVKDVLYFGRVWFFHAHGSLVYFVLISTESFSAYIQHLFMIHFVETPRNFKIWHHILSEYLLLIYHFLCGFFPAIYLFPFSLNWLKFLILNYSLFDSCCSYV